MPIYTPALLPTHNSAHLRLLAPAHLLPSASAAERRPVHLATEASEAAAAGVPVSLVQPASCP